MPKPRFRVDPRDVPAEKAARRIGLSLGDFNKLRPQLERRGFPLPDITTGLYDLDAIDEWRRRRHPHLYQPPLTTDAPSQDATATMQGRLLEAFGSGG